MVERVRWIPDRICQIGSPFENPKNNKILIHICPNMARGEDRWTIRSGGFGRRIGFRGYLPSPNHNVIDLYISHMIILQAFKTS